MTNFFPECSCTDLYNSFKVPITFLLSAELIIFKNLFLNKKGKTAFNAKAFDLKFHLILVKKLPGFFSNVCLIIGDQKTHSLNDLPQEQFQFHFSPGPFFSKCPFSIANSPAEKHSSDFDKIFSSNVEPDLLSAII